MVPRSSIIPAVRETVAAGIAVLWPSLVADLPRLGGSCDVAPGGQRG